MGYSISGRVVLLMFFRILQSNAQIWGSNYRIEVQFARFDNPYGIISNGKRCDVATRCDPVLYSYIDIDNPSGNFPGSARSLGDFQLFLDRRDANTVNMNARIIKNVCNRLRLPETVNARVEGFDYDYFTRWDVIENFECIFPFIPSPREDMIWSDLSECRSIYQPKLIKLYYRWRIFPIRYGECQSQQELLPVARSPSSPPVLVLSPFIRGLFPQTTLSPGVTFPTARTPATPRPSTAVPLVNSTEEPFYDYHDAYEIIPAGEERLVVDSIA
ncbi:uncharacterized protein LOC129592084 isoform X2 [Paramacrobiotus metropolitanus]|nr:uncharacterized protein LOC129592084 isoform X2 [Paramacrobiotus metropolitanus]XP_055344014.1 uncharacterized protein LOC129592084 isoform X2 [Paramacrobiotus metropolitanus]